MDHPRIRGEHVAGVARDDLGLGSSPHTRGAPPPGADKISQLRIIPAYAGSTLSGALGHRAPRDHPRIRGEHQAVLLAGEDRPGSSPHTRGAPRDATQALGVGRIIPAYAGSTVRVRRGDPRARDHPRIRGEHHLRVVLVGPVAGSSPHTRGALVVGRVVARDPRIIPAYAGSTRRSRGCPDRRPDHPRIRGEHPRRRKPPRSPSGSSPHTRGARGDVGRSQLRLGIIPAYAGSTRSGVWRCWVWWDHPRIRGEHRLSGDIPRGYVGSSPHTRGAPGGEEVGIVVGRIIPAYAGSTVDLLDQAIRLADHPRIRGEHHTRGRGVPI